MRSAGTHPPCADAELAAPDGRDRGDRPACGRAAGVRVRQADRRRRRDRRHDPECGRRDGAPRGRGTARRNDGHDGDGDHDRAGRARSARLDGARPDRDDIDDHPGSYKYGADYHDDGDDDDGDDDDGDDDDEDDDDGDDDDEDHDDEDDGDHSDVGDDAHNDAHGPVARPGWRRSSFARARTLAWTASLTNDGSRGSTGGRAVPGGVVRKASRYRTQRPNHCRRAAGLR